MYIDNGGRVNVARFLQDLIFMLILDVVFWHFKKFVCSGVPTLTCLRIDSLFSWEDIQVLLYQSIVIWSKKFLPVLHHQIFLMEWSCGCDGLLHCYGCVLYLLCFIMCIQSESVGKARDNDWLLSYCLIAFRDCVSAQIFLSLTRWADTPELCELR